MKRSMRVETEDNGGAFVNLEWNDDGRGRILMQVFPRIGAAPHVLIEITSEGAAALGATLSALALVQTRRP